MKFARFGILDVFSQTCYVQWQRGDQKIDGVEVLVKLMVLQRGSAACIHAAVEQAIPVFSELRLAYLCKRVGLVIVNSRPDACSANRRKLAFDQHQRAGLDNCLELPGECASHQAHRVVASREPDVRGGVGCFGLLWRPRCDPTALLEGLVGYRPGRYGDRLDIYHSKLA